MAQGIGKQLTNREVDYGISGSEMDTRTVSRT